MGESSLASFPIVCIGASAGGLNSLQCFLSILPRKFGFAVVFMQHLSPKHKSLLPELLRNRRPGLDINEISDGMEVLPGKLYLCPPGNEIKIMKSIFRVSVSSKEHFHLPIDEFFSSLAEEAGERVIGVIFSGAGTDGARGVQAIRNAGGTVFVQDPETAEFPAMPAAAIGTGQADGVLPPEDIAREIVKIYDTGTSATPAEDVVSPGEFQTFYRVIQEKTGHRFEDYKKSVVGRRIRRRMFLRGVSSVGDYLHILTDKESEAVSLASDLMIGVTSFFRDPLAWKALRIGVVRKLIALEEDSPVRAWTPACATGEEAYSIAMMLQQEFDLAGRKREIQVFATDVNDQALERAREGRYPGSIAADVPPEYMKKFFTCLEDGLSVTIGKQIRESVVFAKQDLLTDPPFSKLDLVICRNLLIYLDPVAQEKCLALFHYALKEGGHLFLGNAESVGKNKALFRALSHKKCRIYQKIETAPPSTLSLTVPFASERAAAVPRQTRPAEPNMSAVEIAQETLLGEFAPAAVAMDQNYDILYHNGPTNRYLRQPRGAPTHDLLELLPEDLRNRVRGVVYRTTQESRPVSIRTSISGDDEKKRQVTLRISKLRENLFLVVFREKGGILERTDTVIAEVGSVGEAAVRQLESELAATRAELQTNIEQLKSLNEELQSSNEELQAANEELETSREELQSLNEELITVNAQLQSKVEEEEETNNDLNNFLASANIPTIFLDHQFRVKRFTPAMSKLIKLIPSDVGRPIIDMSQEGLGPELIADAQAVLDSLVPIKKEFLISAAWYVRTALPYRTSDNRIEGVVITYSDVTELKRIEERTKHLASFPQLNPNPVCEVDSSCTVKFCNPATERILEGLGMDKEDVDVFLPPDLDGILKGWDRKTERSLYREVIVGDKVFAESIYLNPQFNVARIYAFDITEIKKAEEIRGRLAAIVESAEDAIIGKDLDGIIQTWNAGAENIFGYKAEEVIGKPVSLLVPPGHTDEVPGILERIKQGEHIENFETVRMRKDGTIIPVSLTFSAIKDAKGKVIGASKIAHDITERKRTEKALLASEEQFRALADSIPNLAWWANGDGYITWYNQRWYEYTGTTPEQMEGWGWQSVHDPEVLPKVLENWKTSIATGEPFDMEFPLRGADGIFRPFLTRVLPLKDLAGRVSRWFGTNTDITERKQAEEALRESEERYRSLFENMLQGFAHCKMLYDESGRPSDFIYLDVNGAFGKLTGLENVAGKRVTEVIPGIREAHLELFEIYGRVALTGRPEKFEIEFKPLELWLSISVYSPEREHFVAIFDDITERKKYETNVLKLGEDMAARNVELETVNKELESFIYSISHDLRAPLRSIAGFVKILVEDYARLLDVQGQDYLARIHNGAEKMSRLIEDLLYLSKISRQEVRRNKVDMSRMASSIVWDLREANPGRSADVRIMEGLNAFADHRLIEIVLSNLLGNAWKFTSKTEKAVIELGALEQDGKTVYYVRDNGSGFDRKYADKMFWPFHRLHSDKEFPGTGIGLTIVERIIHSHGGRVWAEGQSGKGATVYFTVA